MFEKELRDLSFVPRWGIVRTINRQAVSDHSYYVTVYAKEICEYLGLSAEQTLDVVTAAIWHDVPERITGDIPGPVKKHLCNKLDINRVESMAMSPFSSARGHGTFSEHTTNIIKAADYMDQCFFLAIEIQMGNSVNARWIYESSLKALIKKLELVGVDQDTILGVVQELHSTTNTPSSFPPEVFDGVS